MHKKQLAEIEKREAWLKSEALNPQTANPDIVEEIGVRLNELKLVKERLSLLSENEEEIEAGK